MKIKIVCWFSMEKGGDNVVGNVVVSLFSDIAGTIVTMSYLVQYPVRL